MNGILCRQLALDYCVSPEEVEDRENHFSVYRFLDGRRRFEEKGKCFLRIGVVNGKLLFTGDEEMISWCGEHFQNEGAEWFIEAKNLRAVDERLNASGYRIGKVYPFFISETETRIDTGDLDIRWYRGEEIERFRGDSRFDKAYSFCETAPDVIGVSAVGGTGETILGMAGASADSPTMWQIGINVEPEARGTGVAHTLVTLLKNEILKEGALPYYGTAFSHLASQRVALRSGFTPAWVELETERNV